MALSNEARRRPPINRFITKMALATLFPFCVALVFDLYIAWARVAGLRRIMAGVQDEAKHAMSAMSPLKSWLVEKPQPNRKMLQAVLVAVFAAVLLATRLPSR
jgi:hypothetical protein